MNLHFFTLTVEDGSVCLLDSKSALMVSRSFWERSKYDGFEVLLLARMVKKFSFI